MYVCMYVCVHACMHTCMYACMYAGMYVCMYVCMYVYMYLWKNLENFKLLSNINWKEFILFWCSLEKISFREFFHRILFRVFIFFFADVLMELLKSFCIYVLFNFLSKSET